MNDLHGRHRVNEEIRPHGLQVDIDGTMVCLPVLCCVDERVASEGFAVVYSYKRVKGKSNTVEATLL